jgi:hypothetical protein
MEEDTWMIGIADVTLVEGKRLRWTSNSLRSAVRTWGKNRRTYSLRFL